MEAVFLPSSTKPIRACATPIFDKSESIGGFPKAGGTVNIDGVEVQQFVEDYPEYEFSQKYLLLIALYPSGVARTTSGPVGVFKVLPNDKLAPVSESEHKIRKDFKDVYGNSLAQLRKASKNK
jgi:hypothetical protein